MWALQRLKMTYQKHGKHQGWKDDVSLFLQYKWDLSFWLVLAYYHILALPCPDVTRNVALWI